MNLTTKKAPKNYSLEEARIRGAVRYQGVACKRGHQGIRYVSSRKCVECSLEDTIRYKAEKKERRKKKLSAYDWAVREGHKTYIGAKCEKCGHERRKVADRECFYCERSAKTLKSFDQKGKPAPVSELVEFHKNNIRYQVWG